MTSVIDLLRGEADWFPLVFLPMDITFNKTEYRMLLEALLMARWVSDRNRQPEAARQLHALEMLENKICQEGYERGFDDLVEFDEELKGYFPTRDLEASSFARKCLDEYDNDFFWGELVKQLILRDEEVRGDQDESDGLPIEEVAARRRPEEERYWNDFSKNGIHNVHLIPRDPAG